MTRQAPRNDFHTASMVLLIAASAALVASSAMNLVEAQLAWALTPTIPPPTTLHHSMQSVDENLWRTRLASEPACTPLQPLSCSLDPTAMTFHVDRQTFSRLLNGPHATSRFSPVYEAGRVVGFKALHLRRGGFLSTFCIKDGDVLTTLNQHPIGVISAGDIPRDLLDTDRLTIGFERRGLPHIADIFIE